MKDGKDTKVMVRIKAETLIKQIAKKFGKIPEEYRIKIKKLLEEIIDIFQCNIL